MTLLRRSTSFVAGWVAAVALLIVLYRQFENSAAPRGTWVAAGALVIWWAARWVWRPGARAGAHGARVRVAGWMLRGLLIAGAAAWYGSSGLVRERLDPVLAGVAAALFGTHLLLRVGRRPDGVGDSGAVSDGNSGDRAANAERSPGRRMAALIGAGALATVGGLVLRSIGYGIAVAVYRVPVGALDLARGWWDTRWLIVPATTIAWMAWAIVLAALTGLWQTHDIKRRRTIHSHSYTTGGARGIILGGYSHFSARTYTTTNETYYDTDLTPAPWRTGLVPLVQVRRVLGGWSDSSFSSYGSGYSSYGTEVVHGYWRVRLFQFPPAYLPRWFERGARKVSGRR